MRHIAAYLLLQIGGNTNPSAEDIKRVLAAVGIEADDSRLTKLIQELEGKDINKVRLEFNFVMINVSLPIILSFLWYGP